MFKKLLTPIGKLHISVIFGWGVILFNLVNWLVVYGPNTNKLGEFIIWMIILLSVRYSAFKPLGMAETVASGFFALSSWDYFTGQRNAEYASPIFLGILLFLFILFLVRGAILCSFYLIRETYYLTQYYQERNTRVYHRHLN